MGDRPFNPARFNDQIDEALYARAWGPGARLKNERKDAGRSAPQEGQGRSGEPRPRRQAGRLQAEHPVQVGSLPRMQPRGPAAGDRGRAEVPEGAAERRHDRLRQHRAGRRRQQARQTVPGPARSERPALERSPRSRRRDLVHRRQRLVASTSTTRTVTPRTGPITFTGSRRPPTRRSSRRRCSASSRRPTSSRGRSRSRSGTARNGPSATCSSRSFGDGSVPTTANGSTRPTAGSGRAARPISNP